MAQEAQPIDVSTMPDVSRLAREVNETGKPRLMQVGGDVVRLSPARQAAEKRSARPRRHAFTRDDALFGLVGIGTGKTPGGVSGKKHEALARAYRPK